MICDSCLAMTEEEGFGILQPEDYAEVAAEFGSELPDHFCDAKEDRLGLCECSCNR